MHLQLRPSEMQELPDLSKLKHAVEREVDNMSTVEYFVRTCNQELISFSGSTFIWIYTSLLSWVSWYLKILSYVL